MVHMCEPDQSESENDDLTRSLNTWTSEGGGVCLCEPPYRSRDVW